MEERQEGGDYDSDRGEIGIELLVVSFAKSSEEVV